MERRTRSRRAASRGTRSLLRSPAAEQTAHLRANMEIQHQTHSAGWTKRSPLETTNTSIRAPGLAPLLLASRRSVLERDKKVRKVVLESPVFGLSAELTVLMMHLKAPLPSSLPCGVKA